MPTQMTVSAALSKIKMLGKRIERVISQINTAKMYISIPDDTLPPPGYSSKDQFNTNTSRLIQSYLDLVEYRRQLKSAVALSNSTTTVEWNGNTYTVLELIQLKADVESDRVLYNILEKQYNKSSSDLEALRQKSNEEFNRLIPANASEDQIAALSGLKKNPVTLVSPSVETARKELLKAIENITTELDVLLSEKNATTLITVNKDEPTNVVI